MTDWYRQLRIIHPELAFKPGELAQLDAAKLADDIADQHYNAQHLEFSTIWDGDQKAFLFQTAEARAIPRDMLGDYLPEAHRRGIKVFIYMNVHWAGKLYLTEHPSWLQRKADGTPLTGLYGGGGSSCCVNTPWHDWILALTEEMAGKYEIDGIFLDGPAFFEGTCYCDSCRARFRQEYGLELAEITDEKHAQWREFNEFRYESIARFVGDVRAALRKHRPGAPLYMNGNGLHSGRANGRHDRKIIKVQDILGAEGGFIFYTRPAEVPLWKVSGTARFLEMQAEGKPTVIFCASSHMPWRYTLAEPELRLNVAATYAGGANLWMGCYAKDIHDPSLHAVADELAFFEKHAEQLNGARALGETALLWSHDTADYYGSHLPEIDFMVDKPQALKELDYQSSFSGGYEALLRSGTPFRLLDEFSVAAGELAGIKTLLLTDDACLSDTTAAAIRDWVKRGGMLIATNNSSLFDESGRQRPDFALAEVFGANYAGPRGLSQWDVIWLDPAFRQRYGFAREEIPSPAYQVRVRALPGAEVAARYYFPTESRYSPKPDLSPDPAILVNRFGRGECLYFAGTADRLYFGYRLPEYFTLFSDAARRSPLAQVVPVAGTVELILRERGGEQFIHLLNYTGEMERPIKAIVRLKDVGIWLRTTRDPQQVIALRANRPLKWARQGDYVYFRLPSMGHHEVVHII